MTRSPSRASQQPIRAVSPRVRRNAETDDLVCFKMYTCVFVAFCYYGNVLSYSFVLFCDVPSSFVLRLLLLPQGEGSSSRRSVE